jgi:hypothetical protein
VDTTGHAASRRTLDEALFHADHADRDLPDHDGTDTSVHTSAPTTATANR